MSDLVKILVYDVKGFRTSRPLGIARRFRDAGADIGVFSRGHTDSDYDGFLVHVRDRESFMKAFRDKAEDWNTIYFGGSGGYDEDMPRGSLRIWHPVLEGDEVSVSEAGQVVSYIRAGASGISSDTLPDILRPPKLSTDLAALALLCQCYLVARAAYPSEGDINERSFGIWLKEFGVGDLDGENFPASVRSAAQKVLKRAEDPKWWLLLDGEGVEKNFAALRAALHADGFLDRKLTDAVKRFESVLNASSLPIAAVADFLNACRESPGLGNIR